MEGFSCGLPVRGAYLFGGKDTIITSGGEEWSLYDGQQILHMGIDSIIWVVPNYRLGAFGWLAGNTVEKYGTPNAALYDQRLVFQFVQITLGKSRETAIKSAPGAILQGLVRLFIILSPLKEISSRSLEQFYGVLHINGLTTDWVL